MFPDLKSLPRNLSKFIHTGVKFMKLQSYCSFYLISVSYIPFITTKGSYVASGREGKVRSIVMGSILVEGTGIMPRPCSVQRVPAQSAELRCP